MNRIQTLLNYRERDMTEEKIFETFNQLRYHHGG